MRLLTPMTLIVVIGLGLCLITGVVIVLRSMRDTGNKAAPACPRCGAVNRPRARFCSHCGADTLGP